MSICKLILGYFPLILFLSCSSPQRIEPIAKPATDSESGELFNMVPNTVDGSASSTDWKTVTVEEVLNTQKYSYLNVKEAGESYWLATLKADFQKGMELSYRGGLLKTNFKSVEFDRVFEKLYLVSEIRSSGEALTAAGPVPSAENALASKPNLEGVTKLSDIVANPEKFKNKKVKVYGEVTKVNQMIMDRNWLHIKDGTADKYDFVLTSQSSVPVGHSVLFEGVISIDKDFGAGYSYPILLENATFVK
ncbi:MAG: GW dipeptide domain-containing protein [Algoriphagus sp.]|nr:GW dipeptide domain-containing protein [Algoriphagus sp.]